MKRLLLMFSLIGLVAVVPLGSSSLDAGRGLAEPAAGVRKDAEKRRMAEAFGKLPLSFEANEGQTDRRVKFISRGAGYTLFLTPDELVLELRKPQQKTGKPDPLRRAPQPEKATHAVLRIKLAGGNAKARTTGVEELPGKSNYFIGSDRTKWRNNVPNYRKVKVHDVYPGIDLAYYGNQRQLEEDFVVAPGADPAAIAMKISGARKISIADGDLVLAADGGELRLRKPTIYQETAAGRRAVGGTYALRGAREVTFEVAEHDRTRPLIIDPVLAYSTYLGGNFSDEPYGIAVDSAGNAYVAGTTASPDFPGTSLSSIPSGTSYQPVDPVFSGVLEAFVTKINAAGTALVYSTYLGGGTCGPDYSTWGTAIAVDSGGNAYVAGYTTTDGFPGTGSSPIQSTLGPPCGGSNGFVTEFNAMGNALVYSTYLGGSSNYDYATAIAVDSVGNAYVTGSTQSPNFPGTSLSSIPSGYSYQPVYGGNIDAFVTKISAGGTQLLYSTYLGGSNSDSGNGIAVDSAGNAYVTGATESTAFPGTGSSLIQSSLGGPVNAFVTEINAGGTALVYSTYLGGSIQDGGMGIAVDSLGNAYVTGFTSSTNFPTMNPIQSALGGSEDAFVTEINAGGTALVYSTYLGGSGSDFGNGIAVDSAGNAYVTGYTQSTDFPGTSSSTIQSTLGGAGFTDVFVTEINAGGTALVYSTYLGGSNPPDDDQGMSIAVDCSGSVYVTGYTQSASFPGTSTSLIEPTPEQIVNTTGFVTKIAPVAFTTSSGQLGVCSVPLSSLPTPLPTGVTFPYGFFTWTVTGLTPGQTITVTMTFPAPIPSNAQYWKVISDKWTDASSLLTSNGTNVATLTITDGGFGDEDGAVNGQITDPGGLGIPPLQVAVPNVVGLTQTAATTAITGAGLLVGTVTTAPSSTVPSGSVISETPTAGTEVDVGSAVNLVVSAGAPASITATAGTPQSATINTPFTTALAATVMNGAGSPVPGVSVTFTAPASGASGTFANGTATYTTTTNTSGVATATTFTANGTVGSYTVTAAASGVTTVASFSLTNTRKKTYRTSTTLTTSGSPSLVNQLVTFTATVTSTYGPIPDGETVKFYDCGENANGWDEGGDISVFIDDHELSGHNCHEIGTETTASGVATFQTSSLSGGEHIIVARYPGDATFDPSSGRVRQEVLLYPHKPPGR
jgi:hypothetical protein